MSGEAALRRAVGPASRNGVGGDATLAERAYRLLRRDIVGGHLAAGQPLRLEVLKQRYGLSFSPLREALNRLHSERLVSAAALRGFSVAPLSIDEMRDAVETRILIECEALRRAIGNGGDDWEAKIVAAFHALRLQSDRMRAHLEPVEADAESLEVRHRDFHEALIEVCGSPRLLDLAAQLYAQTERYRRPTLSGRSELMFARDIPREHADLMEAALARRANSAAALLAAHYRRTADMMANALVDERHQ